jgi:4-hydroxy-tetrahydrodipicolinate reductase
MARVLIIGGAGRMGQALVAALLDKSVPGLELAGAVDLAGKPEQGKDLGLLAGRGPANLFLSSDLSAAMAQADLFIDFSFHVGVVERMRLLADAGSKAAVIGTTGLTAEEHAGLRALAVRMPLLFSPNMSLGVNLLAALVEEAAARLKGRGYDIEVVETHHRRKLDAPSGTALGSGWELKKVQRDGRSGVAKGERPEQEIGFHALRAGDVVGDHTVMFATDGELIELSHRATRRETFAIGALRATAWLATQTSGRLYGMKDVLGNAECGMRSAE